MASILPFGDWPAFLLDVELFDKFERFICWFSFVGSFGGTCQILLPAKERAAEIMLRAVALRLFFSFVIVFFAEERGVDGHVPFFQKFSEVFPVDAVVPAG
jgi:hypothetical protein